MKFYLSENSIQRGSFPWERDSKISVANYSIILDRLTAQAGNNQFLKTRINKLHAALEGHSCEKIKWQPIWVEFIDLLVPGRDDQQKKSFILIILKKLMLTHFYTQQTSSIMIYIISFQKTLLIKNLIIHSVYK